MLKEYKMLADLIKKTELKIAVLGLAGLVFVSASGCSSKFNDRFGLWLANIPPNKLNNNIYSLMNSGYKNPPLSSLSQLKASQEAQGEKLAPQLFVCKEVYRDSEGKVRIAGFNEKPIVGKSFWVVCNYINSSGKYIELVVSSIQNKEQRKTGEMYIERDSFSGAKKITIQKPGRYRLESYLNKKYDKSYEFEVISPEKN